MGCGPQLAGGRLASTAQGGISRDDLGEPGLRIVDELGSLKAGALTSSRNSSFNEVWDSPIGKASNAVL